MKRKSSIKEVFSNTFTAVLQKNLGFFTASLIAFLLLYSFFYGIFLIPVLEIGFFKDTQPGAFDYFYIVSASLLSALIVTLTKYSIQDKIASRSASYLGMTSAVFAAVCPVCLGVNFVVLGNFITLPLAFLIPWLFWIQLAGLVLLSIGLILTVRYSYEKICIACSTNLKERKVETSLFDTEIGPGYKFALFGMLILGVLFFAYQTLPLVGAFSFTAKTASNGHNGLDLDSVIREVLPKEGFTIDAKWEDSISKMVKAGVLDVNKLDEILTKRYGQPLTTEQRALITSDYSNERLQIDSENAVFMMYVLWVMGKHNDNPILHDSPFAEYFTDYDIGVGKAGYGDTKLIELTPEQQEIAEKVAMNSYRPCCGNPTGHPDCSHGFSALGLVELMAQQGYSEQEIFDAFVKFNSFWFPSTYIQDALYFKLAENKTWSDVDSELIAGKQYSSLSGSYAVKKYLEGLGL